MNIVILELVRLDHNKPPQEQPLAEREASRKPPNSAKQTLINWSATL